jgi:hypothetical protein
MINAYRFMLLPFTRLFVSSSSPMAMMDHGPSLSVDAPAALLNRLAAVNSSQEMPQKVLRGLEQSAQRRTPRQKKKTPTRSRAVGE